MKRALILVMLLALAPVPSSFGFDASTSAAALADAKEAEERYKRLHATVQSIVETQELLLRRNDQLAQRLNAMADEIQTLRDASTRSSGNFATREELREYVKKLQEIEEKRIADRELILKSIKDLARVPSVTTPEPRTNPRTPPAEATPAQQHAEYVVEAGNTLTAIIDAYNSRFREQGLPTITLAQVREANPNLNPDRLVPGMKIRIPIPAKR